MSQLQRLADQLAEVEYKDGEAIIRQGEPGNHFFVLAAGEAVVMRKVKVEDPDEAAQVVMELKGNQTFGERALLNNSTRSASVIARGPVRVLQISRETFEEVLGPLQHLINADRKWRERAAQQKAMASVSPLSARALALADLQSAEALWVSDCTQLLVARLRTAADSSVTLRQTSVAMAVATGRQGAVMRERKLAEIIVPMPFIPAVAKTFRDSTWLTAVLQCSALATLSQLLADTPLKQAGAAHFAASAAILLEHVHHHSVVLRSLSADTLIVDEDGHLQLVDMRFAKLLDTEGRTHTLCGEPEYLAPEVVSGAGHDENADWWALGVLLYYMLTLETPFAKEGATEAEVFRRIAQCQLSYPASVGADAREAIGALLSRDPLARPHKSQLKQMAFFREVDWAALQSMIVDEVPCPPEVQARIKQYQASPVAVPPLEGVPHKGAADWCAGF